MAEISAAGQGFEDAIRRRPNPFRALAAALAAEGERRVLWLPVLFGSGVALYFGIM
jgi:hypothetical protein